MALAVPGDLDTPSGGYAYDRRMIAELRALGWQVDLVLLGEGFPRPTAEQKVFAQSQLAAVPDDVPLVIDGLAFGVLPEAAEALGARKRLIGLVHHPLALETGVTSAQAQALRTSERAALAHTRGVIVTGESTAQLVVDDYGVGSERIVVVKPGTDRGAMASATNDGIVRLVSVGSIVPRKGFDILVEALATLKHLPWRLTIAGDRSRDAAAVAILDAAIVRHGLGDRIEQLGAVTPQRIEHLLEHGDVFVLASHFEGYGMAYAEAIVRGLPVIGTTGGAIGGTVPAAAGILVAPGDVSALADALRLMIGNDLVRRRYADGARAVAVSFPTWAQSAQLFASAVERVQ